MCGEKKSFANSIEMELGSPPHVRGKEKGGVKMALISRITPACAGKRLYPVMDNAYMEDHPRMCGEKFDRENFENHDLGSPPHVRGKD